MATKSDRVAQFWKVIDRVDEWGHHHGYGSVNGHVRARWFWRMTPFPLICDLRDARFGAPLDPVNFPNSGVRLRVLRWAYHDVRPRRASP